jgi:Zn-dependent protease
MGDRTAFNLGRMTLNPIKHFDLMGFLWMMVCGYGWANPVPINARNFKNPKKGMALTALAGPLANFILGLIGSVLFAVCSFVFVTNIQLFSENQLLFNVMGMLQTFLLYFGYLNFSLMFFNLIPVPPFDGSRIFSAFLPTHWYFAIMKYEKYILIGVLVVSIICSRFFGFTPASIAAEWLVNVIANPIYSLLFRIFL